MFEEKRRKFRSTLIFGRQLDFSAETERNKEYKERENKVSFWHSKDETTVRFLKYRHVAISLVLMHNSNCNVKISNLRERTRSLYVV